MPVNIPPDQRNRVFRMSELCQLPKVEYKSYITGVINAGEHSMLIGKAGIGKSVLALQMAICMASGTDFLCYDVRKAIPVLYCQTEGPFDMNIDRIVSMARGIDCNLENLQQMWVTEMKLNLSQGLREFINIVDGDLASKHLPCPKAIVIDSVYSSVKGSTSDDEIVSQYCNNLKQISSRYEDASIILVHHEHKSKKDFGGRVVHEDGMDAVMGSSIWTNHVDSGYRLEDLGAGGRKRLSQWKDRNKVRISPLDIFLCEPVPLLYLVAKEDLRSTELVYHALRTNYGVDGTLTIQELCGHTALSIETVRKALQQLRCEEKIRRVNVGENPARYVKV